MDCDYPQKTGPLWKIVLTNQFHDIIPGSSIDLVYQDSNAHYQEVLGTGAGLRNQALVALLGKPAAEDGNVCAVNTTGVERREVIELPESAAARSALMENRSAIASVPAYGYTVFSTSDRPNPFHQCMRATSGQIVFENELVRAVLCSKMAAANQPVRQARRARKH